MNGFIYTAAFLAAILSRKLRRRTHALVGL